MFVCGPTTCVINISHRTAEEGSSRFEVLLIQLRPFKIFRNYMTTLTR